HKSNIVLTLEAVQRYDPPPPSEYDAAYAPFDPIIAKALAKDRDRRYPDAAEMLDDLRRIVVPRSPERLAQLMGRLFRQQLEEEHRLLLDTDGGRAEPGGSARPSAARTPARPAPTPIAKPESDGGTLILNPAAASGAKKPSTPPQPSAVAGTKRPTTPPGAVRAPARPPAGPPSQRPEEAQAAAREAMAKLQQSQQQAVRTRTRPQGQGEPPRKRSGRGLWIALGAGALGALAGIAALLVWLLSDEPVVPHPRRATAAVVSEAQ